MKAFIFLLIALSISFAVIRLLLPTLTTTDRLISVKSKHENGIVIINNIKYKVKYTAQETLIPGKAEDVVDYIFLSNTTYNESLLSLIIVFALSILIEISIITYYFPNPIKSEYAIIYKLILFLTIAYIVTELIQYQVSAQWVNSFNHHLSGYLYNSYFNNSITFLMVPITAMGMYIYYYKKKEYIEQNR